MGILVEGNYNTSKLLSFELRGLYTLDLQLWLSLGTNNTGKVNYTAHKYNHNTNAQLPEELLVATKQTEKSL